MFDAGDGENSELWSWLSKEFSSVSNLESIFDCLCSKASFWCFSLTTFQSTIKNPIPSSDSIRIKASHKMNSVFERGAWEAEPWLDVGSGGIGVSELVGFGGTSLL